MKIKKYIERNGAQHGTKTQVKRLIENELGQLLDCLHDTGPKEKLRVFNLIVSYKKEFLALLNDLNELDSLEFDE